MKIPTDDPDWAPELYEARARELAMTFVRNHGRWQRDGMTFLVAERNGLTVTYYRHRSPLMLTVDASGGAAEPLARVLKIEWNDGRRVARGNRKWPMAIPAQGDGASPAMA